MLCYALRNEIYKNGRRRHSAWMCALVCVTFIFSLRLFRRVTLFVVEHHLIFWDALHSLLHSSDQNTTVYKSNGKHETLLSEKKRLNPKIKNKKIKYSRFFALPAICLYVHAFSLVRLKHTLFHICDGIHSAHCTESGCTTSWIKCAKNDIAPINTHNTDYLLVLLLFVLKFYRRKKSTRQTWKLMPSGIQFKLNDSINRSSSSSSF